MARTKNAAKTSEDDPHIKNADPDLVKQTQEVAADVGYEAVPSRKGTKKTQKVKLEYVEPDGKTIELDRDFTPICRPEALINMLSIIKEKDKQVKAITEIGFGGLLSIRLPGINKKLICWILEKFNSVGHMLQFGEGRKYGVQLYDYDVYDVFRLPLVKGVDVEETPRKRVEGDGTFEMIQRWFRKYNKKDNVQSASLSEVEIYLANTNEYGDEFKRAFVIYALGVFLAPTSNRLVDIKLLKAVEDVSKIAKQNWCKYVLDHLGLAVCRWNEKITNTRVGGCLQFLEIIYLQRALFRGVSPPKEIPLVQHWSPDEVSERVAAEVKMGFGLAAVDLTSYPLSKSLGDLSGIPHSASGSKMIEFAIPEGFQTNDDIEKSCDDELEVALKKYCRDLYIVSNFHQQHISTLKKGRQQLSDSPGYGDPVFLEIIDSIVAYAEDLKKNNSCAAGAGNDASEKNGVASGLAGAGNDAGEKNGVGVASGSVGAGNDEAEKNGAASGAAGVGSGAGEKNAPAFGSVGDGSGADKRMMLLLVLFLQRVIHLVVVNQKMIIFVAA
ncbi:uncharacterized protein [Spinacia oleracea]|uniref:Aminotransferase-like plant mobile domain-containing protein n=1 Tax=Spinacia oleracea TaxID=3562 RepID=A0ABM3QKW1_SPIOL|nr:uncharacterized protein LOC130460656 [Spinacia oleracea]XP_056683998.1 uncharacterized protein LOC130460656 [Spinacia oleracea]